MLAWTLAQVSGNDGLTSLLTTAGQYGIAAVFIFLYFQERKERNATVDRERTERKQAQDTLAAFVEKHASVLKDAVEALESVQAGLSIQVERAGGTFPRDKRTDLDWTLRRLELAADELNKQANRRRGEEFRDG